MSSVSYTRRFIAGSLVRRALPIAANVNIKEGDHVNLDASGKAVPAARTAGHQYAGMCVSGYDNTGGSAGNLEAAGGPLRNRYVEVDVNVAWSSVVADGGPDPAAGVSVYVDTVQNLTTSSAAPAIKVGVIVQPDEHAPGRYFVTPASVLR